MKISEHFRLEELIHPDIYHYCGDRSADFIHPNVKYTLT